MPSSGAITPAWPRAVHISIRLALAFGMAIFVATWWGKSLVQLLLPSTRAIVLWLDDHFAVQALNLSQNHQDSVIVLRVSLVKALFINRQMVYTHPEGFLEVSTALGTLLQPMVIAGAIAAAWPRRPVAMLLGVAFALCATMLLLVVDIALSLYAYVWDMFHAHYVPDAFSPLLAWLQFMNGGGRLGLGVAIGAVCCR